MQEVYIYGCGGVGDELAEYFMYSEKYKLMGFIDDNPNIRACMGVRSRTLDEMLTERRPEEIKVIISIGEPAVRRIVSEKVARAGVGEVTVDISDHFNPEFSAVGKGTLLHSHSYVSVNAQIGHCCMINKYALVGHDCVLGDYCVLSPKSQSDTGWKCKGRGQHLHRDRRACKKRNNDRKECYRRDGRCSGEGCRG